MGSARTGLGVSDKRPRKRKAEGFRLRKAVLAACRVRCPRSVSPNRHQGGLKAEKKAWTENSARSNRRLMKRLVEMRNREGAAGADDDSSLENMQIGNATTVEKAVDLKVFLCHKFTAAIESEK